MKVLKKMLLLTYCGVFARLDLLGIMHSGMTYIFPFKYAVSHFWTSSEFKLLYFQVMENCERCKLTSTTRCHE